MKLSSVLRPPVLGAAVLVVLLELLLQPAQAEATWSIIALDRDTGRVVIASATCAAEARDALKLMQAVVVPGVGVAAAQAQLDVTHANQKLIFRKMQEGTEPAEIINLLGQDPRFQARQFAIIDRQGRGAWHTGTETGKFAGHVHPEEPGRIIWSVQGNLLADENVLAGAAGVMSGGRPADLIERVMLAMETATERGGDRRCEGRTASVAYILAADASDSLGEPQTTTCLTALASCQAPWNAGKYCHTDLAGCRAPWNAGNYILYIAVDSSNTGPGEDPVRALRLRYNAWRSVGVTVHRIPELMRMTVNDLLVHLQQRSATAITRVRHDRHDRDCDRSRHDFKAILPLAAQAALLASDAYADHPGPRLHVTGPQEGPQGGSATALRATLSGSSLPEGFPRPARWGQSPGSPSAVFVTFRSQDALTLGHWLKQYVGRPPAMYEWAWRYAQEVLARVDRDTLVVFSGHGVGGGAATYAALRLNRGAITFNAVGLHPNSFFDAVADNPTLLPSDVGSVYHFLSHSEEGITDLVGNLSFAGYSLLPGVKHFIRIRKFTFATGPAGPRPDLRRYEALHRIDPLWRELDAHWRGEPSLDLSCTALHGRAIHDHPRSP